MNDVRLGLLRGFELRHREPLDVPVPAQRVIAFLALHGAPVRRGYVAGALWPDHTESRSAANLRTALWQLRLLGSPLASSTSSNLSLSSDVEVDVHDAMAWAQSVLELGTDSEVGAMIARYEAELLPDWYEDWLLHWRQRWQHARVAALEGLADRLRLQSRLTLSIQAAAAAVRAEPHRESSRKILIHSYLAEGNAGQAHQELARFERILHADLAVAPSMSLVEFVRGTLG